MTLGRGKRCTLRIPSGEVSREHCRLYEADGYLMVEDLESVNGTLINGTEIEDAEVIRPGDLLTVGPVTFEVQYELNEDMIQEVEDLGEDDLEEAPLELELLAELTEDANQSEDVPELVSMDEESEDQFVLPLDDDEEEEDIEKDKTSWDDFEFDKSGSLELQDEEFRDFLSQLDEDSDK